MAAFLQFKGDNSMGIFIVIAAYALVGITYFVKAVNQQQKKDEWKEIADGLAKMGKKFKVSSTFQEALDTKIEEAKKMNKRLLADMSYEEVLNLSDEEFEKAGKA